MIKKCISKTFNDQMHALECMKDLMEIEAIKDDGIYSTFKFNTQLLPTFSLTKANLHYCKLDCDDKWLPAQRKILYKNCPEFEFKDVTLPYLCAEIKQNAADRIKMDIVKNDNAIWSTIKVEPWTDHFTVSYDKAYVDKPMTAQEMEIENTKRTLRRIQENSYYGLYPRHSGLTCHFDEKLKEDIKTWKAKADLDILSPSKELLIHKKEEKEKKDMNVTLMVVPNGMNKDFVNKVKANFQSNNSQRLFVTSNDINYDGKHETYKPLKTKYDLFENWIKTGKVDVVYFMLGFEKDPDVRAFEAFVRGITELPSGKDIVVIYQKDDICNDVNNLRTLYFDEADAKEDAARATGLVVKEANAMKEVYSLDDNGLDIIKYSKGKIDASDELIIGKIMDVAFASDDDEDHKPAKKGGKKND